MKTSHEYISVTEYFEHQPKATQKALMELRECILSAAPQAIEMISYNIPAYALVKGGKRDQQIMIAGYKKHVGLYPHPKVMEKFADRLSSYKQGKGSVQFPLDQPLPKSIIIEMVHYRNEMLKKTL